MRLLFLSLLCLHAARADDIDKIRQASLALFCYPAASALPQVAAAAEGFARSLNASGFWPDVDYNDPHDRADWKTITHLSRALTMVQAIATPGSPAYENAALSTSAHLALDVWLVHRWVNDNWWYKWIGVPLISGQIFLLLSSLPTQSLTPFEQAALTNISYDAAWWVNPWGGGANVVWMIQANLYRGLATRNVTAIAQGFSTMWADVTVKSPVSNGQGIMPDGSYHFHGQQPLNFAYGADWLLDILSFHAAANGTAYDLPPASVDVLAEFMANGNAHMSWGPYWDYSLTGRGIDRPGSSYSVPFPPAGVRSIAAATSSPALRAALLAWADDYSGAPGAAPLVGARYFWTSDFATVHRRTWGASLKAHGDNGLWAVVGGECDNGENVKGEHEGDGVLSVYADLARPGAEYVTKAGDPNAVFPLWDWQGLNGITVEADVPLAPCGSGDVWPTINTHFVGAACDGLYLAFAMDTATHRLTAARSWLFFDGVILALAANISNPSPARVQTALASRLLPAAPAAGAAAVLGFANGSSVTLADGNYALPPGGRPGRVRRRAHRKLVGHRRVFGRLDQPAAGGVAGAQRSGRRHRRCGVRVRHFARRQRVRRARGGGQPGGRAAQLRRQLGGRAGRGAAAGGRRRRRRAGRLLGGRHVCVRRRGVGLGADGVVARARHRPRARACRRRRRVGGAPHGGRRRRQSHRDARRRSGHARLRRRRRRRNHVYDSVPDRRRYARLHRHRHLRALG